MLEDNTQGTEEHDVDAIIAQAYGHQNPSAEQASRVEKAEPAPAPTEPSFKEYEFNSRGQAVKIKENDPRFQQWLSQGHDYSQNINQFKSEREKWDQDRQKWEKDWSVYREIDAFAKQNPDWLNTVQQSYAQQRQSGTQGAIPPEVKQYLDQQLAPVAQDIPLMKQFLQEMQTQKMEKQQSDEDARLSDAMKSIQAKYQNLDFAAKDESGFSLEHRVLDHAVKNGIPTFKAAFLDYYHDNLEKLAEARGKEATMKEIEKRKKMGLLDESPAPKRQNAPRFGNSGAKSQSWNDLHSEDILKEMRTW